MKKLLFIIAVILIGTASVFAQNTSNDYERRFVFSIGGAYQRNFFGEVNLMYSSIEQSMGGVATWGPRVGFETNFSKTDFIYAPKIGYEVNLILFALRASVISYFDNGKTDLRLLPEIGITLFGLIDLTYGYNIPLLNYESSKIGRNRITLSINFDPYVFEDL